MQCRTMRKLDSAVTVAKQKSLSVAKGRTSGCAYEQKITRTIANIHVYRCFSAVGMNARCNRPQPEKKYHAPVSVA